MQTALRASPLRGALQQARLATRGSRRSLTVNARKTASKTATYVCLDCGWIYDGKKGPFEDLPSSYRCPVCLAPKRRFKKQEPAAASSRSRKATRSADDGKVDEGDKQQLAVLAAGAAVLLAGLYFYLSSQTTL